VLMGKEIRRATDELRKVPGARHSYFKTLRNYVSWYGIRGLSFAAQSKLSSRPTEAKVRRAGSRTRFCSARTRPTNRSTARFRRVRMGDGTRQRARVILDCGGHIGCSAIYFANRFPNAKIFTIEPERPTSNCW